MPSDEEDTAPDLSFGLPCPHCAGKGMTLRIVETNPDGTLAKALASPCRDCKGAGRVDRETFIRLRTSRRPPR